MLQVEGENLEAGGPGVQKSEGAQHYELILPPAPILLPSGSGLGVED